MSTYNNSPFADPPPPLAASAAASHVHLPASTDHAPVSPSPYSSSSVPRYISSLSFPSAHAQLRPVVISSHPQLQSQKDSAVADLDLRLGLGGGAMAAPCRQTSAAPAVIEGAHNNNVSCRRKRSAAEDSPIRCALSLSASLMSCDNTNRHCEHHSSVKRLHSADAGICSTSELALRLNRSSSPPASATSQGPNDTINVIDAADRTPNDAIRFSRDGDLDKHSRCKDSNYNADELEQQVLLNRDDGDTLILNVIDDGRRSRIRVDLTDQLQTHNPNDASTTEATTHDRKMITKACKSRDMSISMQHLAIGALYEEPPPAPPPAKSPPPPKGGDQKGWPPLANYRRHNTLTNKGIFKGDDVISGDGHGNDGDFLESSDFQLTYEDKDRDWMLVGDVPWEMFVSSARRLRIRRRGSVSDHGICEKLRTEERVSSPFMSKFKVL